MQPYPSYYKTMKVMRHEKIPVSFRVNASCAFRMRARTGSGPWRNGAADQPVCCGHAGAARAVAYARPSACASFNTLSGHTRL